MHCSLTLEDMIHIHGAPRLCWSAESIIPASLDGGLRGRHGKSPETNETVTQCSEMSELTE